MTCCMLDAIADWLVACLMQVLLMLATLRWHSLWCQCCMTCCMLHTSHCWCYQYSGDIQFDAMHIWLVVAFLMPVLLMLSTLWWHLVWCQCCMTCSMLIDGLWWMLPPTFWLYKMLVEWYMVAFILVTRIFLLHFVHELILIFWAHFFAFWIDSHFCNSVVWLIIYALLCFYMILPIFGLIFFCRMVFALFLGFFIDGDGVTIVLTQMESK